MRAVFTLFFVLFNLTAWAQQVGIYQSYVILNVNGTGNQFRYGIRNNDNTNQAFQGSSFGNVSSISLNGGELKSFKNSGADVTGARLFYRVYPTGAPTGTFTLVNLPFAQDNIDGTFGNQLWRTSSANINLASGLPSGNYTLEVYLMITTNRGDQFDSNGGNNYTATFSVTSTTLPVTLTAFNAKATSNRMAQLDWTTASERNNAHFDVERSQDMQSFVRIGRVTGRGTTAARQTYQFTDEVPAAGINYYRLRQVDHDGTFSYSPVRAVTLRPNGELTLLGNPVSDQVRVAGLEPGATLELVDLTGQQRRQQAANEPDAHIDVRELPAGTYLLRVVEPTGVQTKRVLVTR